MAIKEFEIDDFNELISILIQDSYYSKTSNRTKLTLLRQYSEIIIRKIINMGEGEPLLLGDVLHPKKGTKVHEKLQLIEKWRLKEFQEIIQKVASWGNKHSHTQSISIGTVEDVRQAENTILELVAFLFIDYFLEYPIHLFTDRVILRAFSFLPPILRFKVLSYLYKKANGRNVVLVDKLLLSLVKTKGKNYTSDWLEQNQEDLIKVDYPNQKTIEDFYSFCDFEVTIQLSNYKNIYELWKDKINDPRILSNESGQLYKNFEEALYYYKQNRIEDMLHDSIEREKFRDLLNFVYVGRKAH